MLCNKLQQIPRLTYCGQSSVCWWDSWLATARRSKGLIAFIFKVKQKLVRLLDLSTCSKYNTSKRRQLVTQRLRTQPTRTESSAAPLREPQASYRQTA